MALLIFGGAVPATAQVGQAELLNAEPVAVCRAGMRPHEGERGLQLLGELMREDFPNHLPDWDAEFQTYVPDVADLATLAAVAEPVEIICVLGTWCSDSQTQVPRFWKILSEAGNPNLELFMFGTGRSRDEAALAVLAELGFDEGLRLPYDVELVPTFIVSRGGREIGRIIETPQTTLEQDLVRILTPSQEKAGNPGWK